MKYKHRIEAAIVRAGLSLGNLFSWRVISGTGAGLGLLAWHVLRIRRSVTLANLELALGDVLDAKERRRVASRCYAQFGRTFMEYFALPAFWRRKVMERVECEGREHLDAAVKSGRGVLLLSSHFGNWEIMGLTLHSMGLPVHAIVADLSNKAVDGAITDLREKLGMIVDRKHMALRAVVKALRQDHAVGILGDQEARWNGILVPFFGMASLTHPGAARLSLKTGAPILPCFLLRDGKRFRMIFKEPIWPEGEASDERVREITLRHTAVLEDMIRRHPDNWFWLHKRWKRGPKGEDGRPLPMSE